MADLFKPEDFSPLLQLDYPESLSNNVASLANKLLKERGRPVFTNSPPYYWIDQACDDPANIPTYYTERGLLVCVEKIERVCQHEPVEYQVAGYFKPVCRWCGVKLRGVFVPLEEPGETIDK